MTISLREGKNVVSMLLLLLLPLAAASNAAAIQKDAVAQHNLYRARHANTPAIKWSAAVAKSAQAWADRCKFAHSTSSKYGENLAYGHPSIKAAIKAWYDEVAQYDYRNPGFTPATGHFTQVVWKSTKEIGCALGNCGKGSPNLWVCQYSPPGNYMGQFRANVLPLKGPGPTTKPRGLQTFAPIQTTQPGPLNATTTSVPEEVLLPNQERVESGSSSSLSSFGGIVVMSLLSTIFLIFYNI
jgi:Cysteine-rich secretory protein family